jgi:DNA-binding NarL/FixJ family response regulator
MEAFEGNKLTPALRRVLEASQSLRTTDAKRLAAHLNRSPATIRTEFQRILQALDVHSRYAALRVAEDRGWLGRDARTPRQ